MPNNPGDFMPLNTNDLLKWLDQRYPRPLLKVTPGESSDTLREHFLIQTGKRVLIEELMAFFENQR